MSDWILAAIKAVGIGLVAGASLWLSDSWLSGFAAAIIWYQFLSPTIEGLAEGIREERARQHRRA